MLERQIRTHLSGDPIMRRLVERITFPLLMESELPLSADLVKAIIYQQLSTKAATTIYNRYLDLFPDGVVEMERALTFSESDMRAVGISRQKAGYIHNIAAYFQDPDNRNRDWKSMEDDELIMALTSIKGVGTWTVKMILISNMARQDIFATEDLGIQSAIRELYELTSEKKALHADMSKIAEAWRPYRTYASIYLWRWKDGQ